MNPSADATAVGTRPGSVSAPRSTKKTAPSKSSINSWAMETATVVLPMPPGPTMLTKRWVISWADSARTVSSRPTIRVNRAGRCRSRPLPNGRACGVDHHAGSPACGVGLRRVQHFLQSVHNVLLHEEPRCLDALQDPVAIGSDWHRHQALFRNSRIFSGDWRTAYSAFSASADCVAWPHRIDSAPLIDGGKAWLLVLSPRQIRRSVQIASLGHTKFIRSICKSN